MTGKMFKTCAIGVTVAGSILLIARDTQAVVTYNKVVSTGESAPGLGSGVVFSAFSNVALSEAGHVTFSGFLAGPNIESLNDTGIWAGKSDSLRLVSRTKEAAPGTEPEFFFRSLGAAAINEAGHTAFTGDLGLEDVSFRIGEGVWSERSGTLELIARKGNVAPGTDTSMVFSRFFTPYFNNLGQTAILGYLTGTENGAPQNSGVWVDESGSLSLLVRTGNPAPSTAAGVLFGQIFTPTLNDNGSIAFFSTLTGPGVSITNDRGIWHGTTDSLDLVVRTGDIAPSTDAGVVYSWLYGPAQNDQDSIAFRGELAGPGVNSTNKRGIWLKQDGLTRLVAREGDLAPGTGSDVTFRTLNDPQLSGNNQIKFFGSLTGPSIDSTNNFGLWMGDSESLRLIAREGDQAPGMEPGVLFGSFFHSAINGAGQVLFSNYLTGPDPDSPRTLSLWATDHNDVLTPIARQGDLFDINDDPMVDDLRTIALFGLRGGSYGENGLPTSFNDSDQIVLDIEFTDGSEGIFVATVPEPGTLTVLVVGAGWMLGKRRSSSQ